MANEKPKDGAPLTFRESATSADGRLVANLIVTNDFHGMFHEDMSWFIEVRDTADSELLYGTGRSWSGYTDDTDDHRATGTWVNGVAFDEAGNLVLGERDGASETIALPPPMKVPRGVVREACEKALRAAWPDRWQALADGVETLLWPRAENCRLCAAVKDGYRPFCDRCRALAGRRIADGAPPDPAMVLAETIRALRAADAPAARLDEIVAFLEERAALVVAATTPPHACGICGEPPGTGPGAIAEAADLRSPAGRVCIACVRVVANAK